MSLFRDFLFFIYNAFSMSFRILVILFFAVMAFTLIDFVTLEEAKPFEYYVNLYVILSVLAIFGTFSWVIHMFFKHFFRIKRLEKYHRDDMSD
ncbi:hypothetical protein C9I94_06380 [Photobacterium swingsii]|uniref:Uncharacterized protein n=1 Tax=Photobacterium swingsii TaxID=680026 RepID=A0A2T3P8U1_9GAMM|nr:hypothetical protein C9I94_06380 [Photobacterium swingsii]